MRLRLGIHTNGPERHIIPIRGFGSGEVRYGLKGKPSPVGFSRVCPSSGTKAWTRHQNSMSLLVCGTQGHWNPVGNVVVLSVRNFVGPAAHYQDFSGEERQAIWHSPAIAERLEIDSQFFEFPHQILFCSWMWLVLRANFLQRWHYRSEILLIELLMPEVVISPRPSSPGLWRPQQLPGHQIHPVRNRLRRIELQQI